MFPFHKKAKSVSPLVIRRNRSILRKKLTVHRENVMHQKNDDEQIRGGFYVLYFFLWTMFVCVTVYVLFFSPFLRLNIIDISGNMDIARQDIEQLALDDISEKYFGIIPKSNFLVFSGSNIETESKNRFKKIQSMQVKRIFPHTISIRVQERTTVVLWCSHTNTCFYMDENGFAYAPFDSAQSDEQASKSFLKIIDTSEQDIDTNEPLLDSDFVRFISEIQRSLQQTLGIEVDTQCFTPSRFSNELILKTKEGWDMYMNVRLPLDQSLRTVQLLFKKEISEERRNHLKYIDLRTKNRVYYSVEGETVLAPELVSDPIPTPVEEQKKDKKK